MPNQGNTVIEDEIVDEQENSAPIELPSVVPSPVALTRRARMRAYARRAFYRKSFWIVASVPLVLMGIQFWHRMADALGSREVEVVRAMRTADTLPAVESPEFLAALEALTESAIVPGHSLELLVDGTRTFGQIESDLQNARRSIMIQTYSCAPGEITRRLKDVLIDRARTGVKVFLLRDGFGCSSLARPYIDSLIDAGVEVATVRPLRWFS
jgi:phosphatidylserine/phosphatidylglycerophosphate/cardiolipin synthase-like enzyme